MSSDESHTRKARLAKSSDVATRLPWWPLTIFFLIVCLDGPTNVRHVGDECAHAVQLAYIGPGAGIALLGSFAAVFVATLLALAALITWPMRVAWRAVRGTRALARAKVRRVVVLGLDGLDPLLVEQLSQEGLLPNLDRLRQQGTYTRLATTWPPLSPVAWSSFSTGANPGKHGIFDFIARRPSSHQAVISSVRIRPPRRKLRIGKYSIPLSRAKVAGLRGSKPFWNVLSDAGIFSAVLRVPITFPPDKFNGLQLSAMCVPDLRGTQGDFTYFAEDVDGMMTDGADAAGQRVALERRDGVLKAFLPGPRNPLLKSGDVVSLPLKIVRADHGRATLHISGQKIPLRRRSYTPWVRLKFALVPGASIFGICRFYANELDPFQMYCTPLQIDPLRPVMPIAHPPVYSAYLAKQIGPFATLGLAEDTSSLSAGVLGEDGFLEQAYAIHDEREQMFFDALARVSRGVVTCVFDAPDRIQHMFWRFQDDSHPARPHNEDEVDEHRNAIREMYERMDSLVGRTVERLGSDSALLVMSDHGFKPLRRTVDLNAWLIANGYLRLKGGAAASSAAYLADVDWQHTKAYALGLAGIYLNVAGREADGTVQPGAEAADLARELCRRLTGLVDPVSGSIAIHEAVRSADVYSGPYVESAPDVIVGYAVGFRVSWDSAAGKCAHTVFSDNLRAWSGDHCLHPTLVPGVLFSNLKLQTDGASILDLAPTVLDLMGVAAPAYMEGRSLLCDGATS